MKSFGIFTLKILWAIILFWIVTFGMASLLKVPFINFVDTKIDTLTARMTDQFSASVEDVLTGCEISPKLTLEEFNKRTEKKEPANKLEDVAALGLFDFDSEDIKAWMELYLDAATLKAKCD
jgi:hypothetical protein